MNDILTSGLYLVSGLCFYAFYNHLCAGLRRPIAAVHLLFSGMAFFIIPAALSLSACFHSTSLFGYLLALRVNLAAVLLCLALFPWFIAAYTGSRRLAAPLVFTLLFALIFIVNLLQPYTLQFNQLTGLKVLRPAWGEAVVWGAGTPSRWFLFGSAVSLSSLGYVILSLYRFARREGGSRGMLAGAALFLFGVLLSILSRLLNLELPGIALAAFVGMILVMGLTLTRESQQRLLDSEARFRLLIEQAPEAIVVYDVQADRLIDANGSAERILGYHREQLLRLSLMQLYAEVQSEADGGTVIENIERTLAGAVVQSEGTIVSSSGTNLVCEVHAVRLPDDRRTLIRVSLIDITERKRAEEELHLQAMELEHEIAERQLVQEALEKQTIKLEEEVEDRIRIEEELRARELELQGILDNSPAQIYMKDMAGRYLFVNRRWTDQFHMTSEGIKGKTDLEIFPEEYALKLMENDLQVIQGGQTFEFEESLPQQDGILYYQSRKTPLKDSSGKIYALCGISTDITEHKRLEEQFRQSQKMESIGRLAGGVAHDFNNMLSVILGSAQLALSNVAEGSELWKFLDMITTAAIRSSGITRQLLAFSRKEAIVPIAMDLNAHITESGKNLGRLIGEDIHICFHLTPELWTIKMDPSQLDQVLMNLSVNARDAMHGGGNLVMETSNVHVDGSYSHLHLDTEPGDYVLLTVSDTGCGMDSETQKRIFEPFFTTKAIGEGTGLGLSTVYGIVTQNGGFIRCYSEPRMGTTFYVYLPRLSEGAVEEKRVAQVEPTGKGTILLVEDEEMLIAVATKMLEQLGYTVIQAQSPHAAIAICEKNEPVDLILTDVIMPEMNGKEMIEKIKLNRPGVQVMFMSGYTADIVARRGIIEEGMHYIQKPLEISRLSQKIGEVLRGKIAPSAAVGGVGQEAVLPRALTADGEVIDLFVSKAPEYVGSIQAGIADGDFGKVHFFSHKLKGAAAAVGCHSLVDVAGELEILEASEGERTPGTLARLNEELERVLSVLKVR